MLINGLIKYLAHIHFIFNLCSRVVDGSLEKNHSLRVTSIIWLNSLSPRRWDRHCFLMWKLRILIFIIYLTFSARGFWGSLKESWVNNEATESQGTEDICLEPCGQDVVESKATGHPLSILLILCKFEWLKPDHWSSYELISDGEQTPKEGRACRNGALLFDECSVQRPGNTLRLLLCVCRVDSVRLLCR